MPTDTPSPRRRLKPEERRAELLEAATALVLDEGATELTMKGLARRSGVNKALLYHYFDSRDALLAELHERTYADYRTELTDAIGEQAEPVAKLRAVVRASLEPSATGVLLHAINEGGGPELDASKAHQNLESTLALSTLLFELYGGDTDTSLTVAATFLAGIQGYDPAWRILGWDLDDAVDRYVAMIVTACTGAPERG